MRTLLIFCAALLSAAFVFGSDLFQGENLAASVGWLPKSPREEIRPAFEFKNSGGPLGQSILLIRTDEREGLDGCWTRSFQVKGGQYYHFRPLRRLQNVASPRRAAPARILWRDEK